MEIWILFNLGQFAKRIMYTKLSPLTNNPLAENLSGILYNTENAKIIRNWAYSYYVLGNFPILVQLLFPPAVLVLLPWKQNVKFWKPVPYLWALTLVFFAGWGFGLFRTLVDLPSSLIFIMNPSSESGVKGELGYGLRDCWR